MSLRPAAAFFAISAFASAANAEGLPRLFLGTWADSAQSCETEGSDGRMKIEPRSVEFFASGYAIRRWTQRGGVWRGVARISSEGEEGETPGSIVLRLGRDGSLRVRTSDGGDSVFVRCARNRGVR